MRDPPELFPGMDIRNMYFDHRSGDPRNGISDGDGRVRIPARIHDDPVAGKAFPLQGIDQFALDIALKIRESDRRKTRFQGLQVIFEGFAAVNAGFTLAQEVEIRTVDDGDMHIAGET